MRVGVGLPMEDVGGVGYPYRVIREMALSSEAAGFDAVWVYDHLLFRDGRRDDRPPRGLDDPDGHRRGDGPGPARHDRAVHRVPQPGAPGQDGGHPRPRQRRAAHPRASAAAGTTPSTTRSATRPTTRSGRFEDSLTIIRCAHPRRAAPTTQGRFHSVARRRAAPAGPPGPADPHRGQAAADDRPDRPLRRRLEHWPGSACPSERLDGHA